MQFSCFLTHSIKFLHGRSGKDITTTNSTEYHSTTAYVSYSQDSVIPEHTPNQETIDC